MLQSELKKKITVMGVSRVLAVNGYLSRHEGLISTIFYEQLFRMQIPKVQKDSKVISVVFFAFRICLYNVGEIDFRSQSYQTLIFESLSICQIWKELMKMLKLFINEEEKSLVHSVGLTPEQKSFCKTI